MTQFDEHRTGKARPSGYIALIGVGANLPGPDGLTAMATCQQAVAALKLLPGVKLWALSRWFVSAPVPRSDQPPYVNAVAALSVDSKIIVDPAVLLAGLMAIEDAFGRQRSVPNAARTLDLDIITFGDLVRDAPDPILPHPRAHLRAFVLAPLVDVAPEWRHPVLHQTAAALLAALPPQDIHPL